MTCESELIVMGEGFYFFFWLTAESFQQWDGDQGEVYPLEEKRKENLPWTIISQRD